ncbi:MAG: hypothetical protein MR902_01500 [Campylobacter sp.]|nr:hypothetical protein [Campylobacter sp.]
MQAEQEKPIFIMQRKKSLIIILYYIFAILWDLATAFICIIFMTLDNIIPNIIGLIFLIFLPYMFFCGFDIKEVVCYEDYLLVKRTLCSKKFFYTDIKDYWLFRSIINNNIVLRFKKFRFGVHINKNMFNKDDFIKFIQFLEQNKINKLNYIN